MVFNKTKLTSLSYFKSFVIIKEEGIEKGIFIRNPYKEKSKEESLNKIFYFKRKYSKLESIGISDNHITRVVSCAYIDPCNHIKEKTTIFFNNGKKTTYRRRDYHFTKINVILRLLNIKGLREVV